MLIRPCPTIEKYAIACILSRTSLSGESSFKGHELTRKDRRLTCGISQIDALIGGIARGRISEITGPERCAKDLKQRHARV